MLSRRAIMNDEIVSAEGKNLLLQKCKGSYFHGMKVYGHTTQDGTPTPESPIELVSAGDKGNIEINVSGKNLFNPYNIEIGVNISGSVGDYININSVSYTSFVCKIKINTNTAYSWKVKSKDGSTFRYKYAFVNSDGKIINIFYFSGASLERAEENKDSVDAVYLYLNVIDLTTEQLEIQVEQGADCTDYEPPVHKNLTFSVPNGLPGIPVSSGGNYTDETGQQWISDYRDWERGVDVQLVAIETPNTTFTINATDDINGRYLFANSFDNLYKNGEYPCLITHGSYFRWGIIKGSWSINASSFYYYPEKEISAEDVREKIFSLIDSDNPLTFIGQLATPIETPIPADELAAYHTLHTNTPNTTIGNDEDCYMKVGYRRIRG